jgi:hypothetical protein
MHIYKQGNKIAVMKFNVLIVQWEVVQAIAIEVYYSSLYLMCLLFFIQEQAKIYMRMVWHENFDYQCS